MKFAVIGAVRKRNRVISSSCIENEPLISRKYSIEAISTPPTPSVVALVGACRRCSVSGSLSSPKDPTSPKIPLTTRKKETRISAITLMAASLDDVAAQDEAAIGHGRDESDHGDQHRRLVIHRRALV